MSLCNGWFLDKCSNCEDVHSLLILFILLSQERGSQESGNQGRVVSRSRSHGVGAHIITPFMVAEGLHKVHCAISIRKWHQLENDKNIILFCDKNLRWRWFYVLFAGNTNPYKSWMDSSWKVGAGDESSGPSRRRGEFTNWSQCVECCWFSDIPFWYPLLMSMFKIHLRSKFCSNRYSLSPMFGHCSSDARPPILFTWGVATIS